MRNLRSLAVITAAVLLLGPGIAASPAVADEPSAAADGLLLPPGATLAPPQIEDLTPAITEFVTVSSLADGQREDTTDRVKVRLGAKVLFSRDSAKLSPGATSRISQVAKEIRKEKTTKVTVSGHTDNLGSAAHGDQLSRERARAVRDVLATTLGDDVTYKVRGYGERDPVADNSKEKGREKNRRVEITFPRLPAGRL